MTELVQYLLAGISMGSIYAVVAVGFTVIYNTTGIINFAQGEFVMLGGMLAVSLAAVLPLPAAIALAVLLTMGIGALVELLFIRPLRSPTVLQMIIVTIGASIVLREGALHVWDEKVHALPYFTGNEVSSTAVLGAHISPQVFWVLGTCALTVLLLRHFFKHTFTGRAMRACAANRLAASLCGVPPRKMVTLAFVISAGSGALAGAVISPLTQTTYDCGTALAIKGFTAAVLGGLGSTGAAVAAGLLLGVIEAFSTKFLPLAYKDVVTLTILLLILCIRPTGLFRRGGPIRHF